MRLSVKQYNVYANGAIYAEYAEGKKDRILIVTDITDDRLLSYA